MANALPLLLAVGAVFLLMRGKGGDDLNGPGNISVFRDGDLPNQIEQDHGYPALIITSNTLSISTLRARILQAAIDNPDINFGIIGSEEFSVLASQWDQAVDGVGRVTITAARVGGVAQQDVMNIPTGGISEEELVAAVLAGVAFIRQSASSSARSNLGLSSGTKQATLSRLLPMSLSNNALSASTNAGMGMSAGLSLSSGASDPSPSLGAQALEAWTS